MPEFPTDTQNAWGQADEATQLEQPEQPQQAAATEEDLEALTKRIRDMGWAENTPFDYEAFQQNGGNNADWLGAAPVYEWQDEYGEVGPAVPQLEAKLFAKEHRPEEGRYRDALEDIEVHIEGPQKIAPVTMLAEAGLHPVVLQNTQLAGYVKPTSIQAYTIPAVKLGYDVVGISQTGSGKTGAYLISILSKLMGKAKKLAAPRPDPTMPGFDPRVHGVKAEPLVVVVVPTRELAIQIFDEARRMCYRSMLRPSVAYGGLPMVNCRNDLARGCDILIATPGRLCDLMDKPELLTLSRVKFTVIDEADEMLDQDWQDELAKIMAGGDTNEDADHQFMMFSATFPKGARELARNYMAADHVRIRVGRPGQSHRNIRQNIIWVDQDAKREAILNLILSMEEPGRVIIFCNSKIAVDHLDDFLYNRGLPTTSIHGDRNQREREDAMRSFRIGRNPILIATGVSARGWDIKDVVHVINYDLPSGMYGGITEYTHRIGRTARMGHQGLATSFYNDRNEDIAQDLVNLLVESACEVPEFLSHLTPEDGNNIAFDDDTDDEAEAGDGEGGDAWGGGAADGGAAGWGSASAEPTAADTGFTAEADTGFTPAGGASTAATSDW